MGCALGGASVILGDGQSKHDDVLEMVKEKEEMKKNQKKKLTRVEQAKQAAEVCLIFATNVLA